MYLNAFEVVFGSYNFSFFQVAWCNGFVFSKFSFIDIVSIIVAFPNIVTILYETQTLFLY